MFQKLRNRIRMSLFVFLSIFSLLTNGVAFYILASYNHDHLLELAKAHSDQQYQNMSKRLAVMGEGCRLFCEGSLFQLTLAAGEWSDIGERVSDFMRASNYAVGGRTYIFDEDGVLANVSSVTNLRFIDLSPNVVLELAGEQQGKAGGRFQPVWFLRESPVSYSECLSYLFPLYLENGELEGFFVMDVNWKHFAASLTDRDSDTFGAEALLLRTPEGRWSDPGIAEHTVQLFEELPSSQFVSKDGTLSITRQMPGGRDSLLQMIPLGLWQRILSYGLRLFLVFLVSLPLFYFLSGFIADTVAIPLRNLYQKMDEGADKFA